MIANLARHYLQAGRDEYDFPDWEARLSKLNWHADMGTLTMLARPAIRWKGARRSVFDAGVQAD